MGIPTRLSEVGIARESLSAMAQKVDLPDAYVPLGPSDVLKIYEMCF